ncbi:MAG: hypothetical protein VX294_03195 [Candidatus Latescibacterota bacterium]|nr:hypothetical protein [Candidatus Latescibacterota bacterium]
MNQNTSQRDPVIASWGGADSESNRNLGMLIFLIALGIFFAVGIGCFLLYRFFSPAANSMAPLYLPQSLWLSSGVLMVAALFVFRCTKAAGQEDFVALDLWLWRMWAAAWAFVLIQIPALLEMMSIHFEYVKDNQAGTYGISFALILLHALHVVGGLIPITRLAWQSRRGRLGTKHLKSVYSCAHYWHFLEVVWVLLLFTLLLAG